jgi:hypothetical protein
VLLLALLFVLLLVLLGLGGAFGILALSVFRVHSADKALEAFLAL